MKRLNISKFLKATPAVVVLSTTLLAGPTSSFAKEGSTKQAVPQGQVVSANTLQKGLLSHYFKDKDFKDLSFITTQTTGNLYSISPGVKPLLGSGKFQSAYWEGRIKIDESQIYQFTTSADKFVKLWIDGVQVIDQRKGDSMSKYKQRVYLQKGKVYNIKVEYQNPYYAISDLTLYWTKGNDLSGSKKEVIPENHLFLPELAPNGSNSNSVKRSRVARSIDNPEQQPVKKTDKLKDSDDNRIPDTIETNGEASENEIDGKRDKEDTKRKENKERMKEIAQRVVQIEVKDEGLARKEATEKLLKDLPPQFLEMYDKIGGKIRIVDGNLAKQPDLKNQKVVDDTGKEVNLDKYYAYVLEGKEPVLFIRASEDYEESIHKRTNVYTEIGKSLIRDVLKPEVLLDPSFLKAVNQIRLDKDVKEEFFTPNLNGYKGSFDENYVKEHIKDFQHIFAKTFAYSRVPEFKEFLDTYIPGMYDYFDKVGWGELKEQKKNEALDFSSNIDTARKWGEENYKDWQVNLLKAEKTAITAYTGAKYDPINQYLRENKGVLKDGEKLNTVIKQIDSGLEKTVTSKPITVYKRVSEGVFNREYGELRSLQAPYAINGTVFQKIKEEFTNKEVIGHGFESTSLAKDPSKSYSNDRYPILYKITVPEGIRGAFIEPISKYNDQLEFLIARGYTYKLNNFSIMNTEDKPYVQVEVSIVKPDEEEK
ncbi:Putative ADP-ribosyltransferase Certhrax (plasmid) [Bacillus cereus]|uniref:ADP-ribosyltransferase n=1 Tax=Bacillus cereus TaxID=1396 RepID=UPI000744BD11|nr:ADP-ribosyltransferase [Bacillus cereus]ALZ64491.1 Putative ADP-ribosyltransferase Certhrax [Bacillus cereus]